jgi:hypothetical protein
MLWIQNLSIRAYFYFLIGFQSGGGVAVADDDEVGVGVSVVDEVPLNCKEVTGGLDVPVVIVLLLLKSIFPATAIMPPVVRLI